MSLCTKKRKRIKSIIFVGERKQHLYKRGEIKSKIIKKNKLFMVGELNESLYQKRKWIKSIILVGEGPKNFIEKRYVKLAQQG